ncbi:hypothetical protein QEZ54_02440 [Catellatospora sp. KI3]|uniref:hypothetical protein n=1 Tax=Catellatospora sp. KI3 TaxID=3041620 RepID=UPI002482360D|nr:hypothetical protein [Catellatospora sp. KI3]MDI1459816.1 hypothetical protein [Catellatospora sp. KI3]
MHLVTWRLRGDGTAHTGTGEGVVTDLIWALSRPDDGVDHVVVRIQPGRMAIVLFVRALRPGGARDVSAELVNRVAEAPAMRGWHLL